MRNRSKQLETVKQQGQTALEDFFFFFFFAKKYGCSWQGKVLGFRFVLVCFYLIVMREIKTGKGNDPTEMRNLMTQKKERCLPCLFPFLPFYHSLFSSGNFSLKCVCLFYIWPTPWHPFNLELK